MNVVNFAAMSGPGFQVDCIPGPPHAAYSAKPKRTYNTSPLTKEQYRKTKDNAVTLVECSNACPFISHYDQYRCFYCAEVCSDVLRLRQHTSDEHSAPYIRPRVDAFSKGKFLMVDITDLKCKICEESAEDLYKLKIHLSLIHQKPLHHDATDGLIPFRLCGETLACLLCGETFKLFQMLNRHMNTHYGDKVCDICGAGFLSPGRLKSHRVIHSRGSFPCDDCDKVFPSQAKKRHHINRMHLKLPRYKCPKCPENFNEYYLRITHMYNVHDINPPEHKCDHCGQVFRRKYLVNLHKKKFHADLDPDSDVIVAKDSNNTNGGGTLPVP